MELMDLSMDRLYSIAQSNQYDISEHFIKKLAFSVSVFQQNYVWDFFLNSEFVQHSL